MTVSHQLRHIITYPWSDLLTQVLGSINCIIRKCTSRDIHWCNKNCEKNVMPGGISNDSVLYLIFNAFGNQTLPANRVHRTQFKWFQLKNVPIQPEWFFPERFWYVHGILNILKYGLTFLVLILEKSANFQWKSNGKSFLDLYQIACGYNGAYLKMIGILKYVPFEYWINIELHLI